MPVPANDGVAGEKALRLVVSARFVNLARLPLKRAVDHGNINGVRETTSREEHYATQQDHSSSHIYLLLSAPLILICLKGPGKAQMMRLISPAGDRSLAFCP
jgi:hypothetical protein